MTWRGVVRPGLHLLLGFGLNSTALASPAEAQHAEAYALLEKLTALPACTTHCPQAVRHWLSRHGHDCTTLDAMQDQCTDRSGRWRLTMDRQALRNDKGQPVGWRAEMRLATPEQRPVTALRPLHFPAWSLRRVDPPEHVFIDEHGLQQPTARGMRWLQFAMSERDVGGLYDVVLVSVMTR